MTAYHARYPQLLFFLGDAFFLNLAFLAAASLRFRDLPVLGTEYYDYYLQLAVVSNLLWFLLSLIFKSYPRGAVLEARRTLNQSLKVFSAHLFLILLLIVSLKKGEYSRLFISYFYLISALLILPWRFYFTRLLRAWRRRQGPRRKAVLVGEAARIEAFRQKLKAHPELGLQVVGLFADTAMSGFCSPETGERLEDFLEAEQADELYLALRGDDRRLGPLYQLAQEKLLRLRLLPDWALAPQPEIKIDFYQQQPVISFAPEPLAYAHNRWLKRLFDLSFSALGIILLYPWLFPLVMLLVKLNSPGPIFFRQARSGYRGQVFEIIKFRSLPLQPQLEDQQVLAGDLRLRPIGRFLRASHLDELPQLWQVLRGQMSLVGPRPHMLAHTEAYRSLIEGYMVRHWVKPGLTGLAQVNGLHGAHKLEEMKARVEHDVYYLQNWNLLLDISILLRTPAQVLGLGPGH